MKPKIGVKPGFTADIVDELKKVTWPSRKETGRLTAIVILTSLIIAAYVGIIDVVLAKILEFLTSR